MGLFTEDSSSESPLRRTNRTSRARRILPGAANERTRGCTGFCSAPCRLRLAGFVFFVWFTYQQLYPASERSCSDLHAAPAVPGPATVAHSPIAPAGDPPGSLSTYRRTHIPLSTTQPPRALHCARADAPRQLRRRPRRRATDTPAPRDAAATPSVFCTAWRDRGARRIPPTAPSPDRAPAAAGSSRWEEVEGAFVLFPPGGARPAALVHFIGGAFVGASPHMSARMLPLPLARPPTHTPLTHPPPSSAPPDPAPQYRLFLESLSARGAAVVATPFATSFDHLRIADEAQFTFDRARQALGARAQGLPVFGLGHSMGSLAHLLICARCALNPNTPTRPRGGDVPVPLPMRPSAPASPRLRRRPPVAVPPPLSPPRRAADNVARAGNALLSFNNKPATDAIPLFAPVVSPLAQGLNPLLSQWPSSPLRGGVDLLRSQLRGAAPPRLRALLPILDQLEPLTLDVAAGRSEFSPAPAEAARLVRTYYGVRRNLLVRFKDDAIDETPALAAVLQESAAASNLLELTLQAREAAVVVSIGRWCSVRSGARCVTVM